MQAAKRARMGQQSDAELTRQQNTDDIQREMMKMAADSGALTPEVLQDFVRQQGCQKPRKAPYPFPSCQQIVQP